MHISRDQKPGSTATYNGKCYIFYGQQPKQFQIAKGNHYLDINNWEKKQLIFSFFFFS